jgi:Ca2+-binding EF-hand superfamily protein
MKKEIKRQFKEHKLDIKTLFALKWEFSRRDIYTFQFSNDKELKFFIENLNISMPDPFISLIFESVVHPQTGKINFMVFKQFIDICQDTVHAEDDNNDMKELIQGIDTSVELPPDSTILKRYGK